MNELKVGKVYIWGVHHPKEDNSEGNLNYKSRIYLVTWIEVYKDFLLRCYITDITLKIIRGD